ncbi:fumarylacetoacetate hydrolase family protein [Novosphingobium sp. AAP83]|uniref:fumarylacetoacetate hydrolase family protein n=1 Tax=Novosphingobium sp. AAP83 TaxID=1523425 RepID=UPI0006B96EAE
MQISIRLDPLDTKRPLMYQGMSDRFPGPWEDVTLPGDEYGIDFEGEFGVIVDHVPMGTCAADAARHMKLVVHINDWSLRDGAICGHTRRAGIGLAGLPGWPGSARHLERKECRPGQWCCNAVRI